MSDNAKAKGRKRKILIPVLLIVTLAACSVAGYAVWRIMNKHEGDKPEVAKVEPPPAPVFLHLIHLRLTWSIPTTIQTVYCT